MEEPPPPPDTVAVLPELLEEYPDVLPEEAVLLPEEEVLLWAAAAFPTVATSKTPRMKIRKARPRAIRMALRIFISGDKFPTGGKTYIENYPAIGKARSEIELAVR